MTLATSNPVFGLMAEFSTPEALLAAAEKTHAEGYRQADAYTPVPIEGLSEALGIHRSYVPLLVLLGGIAGGLGGFFMQYFASVIHYPLNVGGRPYYSWPAFIPITFETTILAAALTATLCATALNGLPQPYHPVFNVPQFQLASRDRFFLVIPVTDEKFDMDRTRRFLESLAPASIAEVPR